MSEYVLPSDNQGQWIVGTDTGVTGGIAQYLPGGASERTTLFDVNDYGADPTGVGDSLTAIQTAAAAAKAAGNGVVWFPNGTYYCSGGFGAGLSLTGITFRGESRDGVVIKAGGNVGCGIGNGNFFDQNRKVISGTKTKGTTTFTVPDTTNYFDGCPVLIEIDNEDDDTRIEAGAAPTWNVKGERYVRGYVAKVTAVTSTTITVAQPLPWDATHVAARISQEGAPLYMTTHVGIEDMTIEPADGNLMQFACVVSHADECWLYNCKLVVNDGSANAVKIANSVRFEIRRCITDDVGEGDDGSIQWLFASGCVFEDNIFLNTGSAVYNSGRTAYTVVAYNYCEGLLLTAHDPNPSLELYEGNVTPGIQPDGYFGGSSFNTAHRNWFTGVPTGFTLALNRFTRNHAFVGNIIGTDGAVTGNPSFGNPNMGNSDFDGTAEPTTGDFWADWKLAGELTTRTSDTQAVVTMDSTIGQMFVGQGDQNNGPSIWWNNFANFRQSMEIVAISGLDVTFGLSGFDGGDVMPIVGTEVRVYTGQGGYQEKDLDVENSAILGSNYYAAAGGTGSLQNSIAPDTLAVSMAHESEPDWYDAGVWPPFDPNDYSTANIARIPAGYRYLNGSASGELTCTTLNVTTLTLG